MADQTGATGVRPRSYRVDAPVHKVQTLEIDGEIRYLFRHDFTRLDSSNFSLLTQHENDTMRVTEQIAKGQFRQKNRSLPADGNLYKALIQSGGWRPADLESVRDEESIPTSAREIYTRDGEKGVWEPGWFELTKEQMSEFVVERQSNAIARMLQANAEYVGAKPGDISFMFEKSGVMRIRLNIGDPEEPAYKLLLEMRRPDSKRRTRFREDFVYNVDHQGKPGKKNDFGKTETRIDLEQGYSIFKEFFARPIDDSEHSLIVFGEELNAPAVAVRPYTEEDKDNILSMLSPNYMVEVAAAMTAAFSKTDRESSKR